MYRENPETRNRLSAGTEPNEPENPRVKRAVERGEIAKVLVQRDQDASLAVRDVQDLCITWIPFPLPAPDYIVARCFEFSFRAAPDAGIQEKPQSA